MGSHRTVSTRRTLGRRQRSVVSAPWGRSVCPDLWSLSQPQGAGLDRLRSAPPGTFGSSTEAALTPRCPRPLPRGRTVRPQYHRGPGLFTRHVLFEVGAVHRLDSVFPGPIAPTTTLRSAQSTCISAPNPARQVRRGRRSNRTGRSIQCLSSEHPEPLLIMCALVAQGGIIGWFRIQQRRVGCRRIRSRRSGFDGRVVADRQAHRPEA